MAGELLLVERSNKTAAWFLRSLTQGLKRGSVSFPEFVEKYFAHYKENEPSQFHIWLMDFLAEAAIRRSVKAVIKAPRGSAKSSYVSVFFVIYCMCEKLEDYIILSSDTFSQGIQHLKNIKEEIEHNEKLAEDYPDVVGEGPTWARDSIVTNNGIRIDVVGTLGKIRGRRKREARPSLILLDDPENDESACSPAVRAKTLDWFDKGVMKAGRPGTNVIVLGTVINAECLVQKLGDRPGWDGFTFKAIVKWPDNMTLWETWETIYFTDTDKAHEFYLLHKKEMHEGSEVLWEDREPLLDLMKMRAEEGPISFMSEKQNHPINPTRCRFEESWFEGENQWFTDWPTNGYYFAACDPVLGKDAQKGDYCAWLWGCWVPGETHIYVDAYLERLSSKQSIDFGLGLAKKFKLQGVGWESNGFQSVVGGDLADAYALTGQALPIVEIWNNDPKHLRIERLASYLYQGRLRWKAGSKGAKRCRDQTRLFPIADHDDGPDALEMLLRVIASWVQNRGRANTEVTIGLA
jgi:hypothetical protein